MTSHAGVAIIDYGSGNLRSAAKAFERAVADAGGDCPVVVTADAEEVYRAERVVLPGVGAFADCMAGLKAVDGMIEAMEEAVRIKGRPFLGICVGMQLLATQGLEHGAHAGLGWIGGTVAALAPDDASLKIPHMGWNELVFADPRDPLFKGIGAGSHAYFVHGYAMTCDDRTDVLATTDYGGPIAAAVGRGNIVGTQFHPEKSQRVGLRLISNFLAWKP